MFVVPSLYKQRLLPTIRIKLEVAFQFLNWSTTESSIATDYNSGRKRNLFIPPKALRRI